MMEGVNIYIVRGKKQNWASIWRGFQMSTGAEFGATFMRGKVTPELSAVCI